MVFSIEQKAPDQPALLSDSGREVTYGGLCEAVQDFGGKIEKNCLLFCLCENSPGSVIGYLGALEGRSVPLLLDAGLSEQMMENLYDVYHPAYVWMPLEGTGHHRLMRGEILLESEGYVLVSTGNERFSMNPELALLLATSGSTGSPRLVRLSRKNIESNASAIVKYLELDNRERPITTLPMQYTYGLSVINSHLLAGGCILMTGKSVVQREFWEFFRKGRATSISGVPYTYEILKRIGFLDMEVTGLSSMTQAGGKLPVSLQKQLADWAKARGIRFYVMYGQTEATARMGYLPWEHCGEKTGSIGIPVPGGRFWLRDENGERISESETVGELIYEGENVTLGYSRCREDLAKGDERQGQLATGDLAKYDKDGYYYIVGRKTRFVKMFGVRVSLDACEQLLREQYPECEAACVGTDDHLRIFVTSQEVADGCCDWLSDMLHISMRGMGSICVEQIPKNSAGKIQYSCLQETDGKGEKDVIV